ncbi:hypothetical protein [Arcticibacter tournemirensis]
MKGFIFSNSLNRGTCDYCGSTDADLIDPRELEEIFLPVVGIYKTISDLGIAVTNEMKLHEHLQSDWNIFNLRSTRKRNELLQRIISGTYTSDHPIFKDPVEIAAIYTNGMDADFHEKKWDNFADEIKSTNRYFLKETIDLRLLEKLLRLLERTYSKGKIFYRARISSKDGYLPQEIVTSPKNRTV